MEIQSADEKLKSIARKVEEELPPNTGFLLVVFPFVEGYQDVQYISNNSLQSSGLIMKQLSEQILNNEFEEDE